MDIHKPKPWHGWREFLKEYLIIVVGVLTALAAEQFAEYLHWREKVARAEETERPELQALYFNAYERDHIQSCMERRIDDIKAALIAGGETWTPLPMMQAAGRTMMLPTVNRGWRDQVWRSLVADGTASHLPPQREQLYADIMGQAEQIDVTREGEGIGNAAFNILQNPIQLSPELRNQLLLRLEEEKARSYLLTVSARQFMRKIERLTKVDVPGAQRQLERQSSSYQACDSVGLLPPGSPAPHPHYDANARWVLGMPKN
jgi:hypothetical protein